MNIKIRIPAQTAVPIVSPILVLFVGVKVVVVLVVVLKIGGNVVVEFSVKFDNELHVVLATTALALIKDEDELSCINSS